jgi:hypothetical protein
VTPSHYLGRQFDGQKIYTIKYTVALNDRGLMILDATTNQKLVAASEGSMEGKCDEQEVQGKLNSIVLVGAALKNFPPQNKKTHRSSTYARTKKVRTNKTTSRAPPPQFANFPSQCIEQKLTLGSIFRDIDVAHSQL